MTWKRSHVVGVLWVGVLSLLLLDALFSAPLDPFRLPPPVAWGSGSPAAGGFCAAPLE
jgi:hypothetical protein